MEFMCEPQAIEKRSMAIIEENLPELSSLAPGERKIVERVAHATGDVSYAGLLRLHSGAVEAGLNAIRAGRPIVTDVKMLKAGINALQLKKFGIPVSCYIDDPKVVSEARQQGVTRAIAAMRLAAPELNGGIAAIGNAPTALFTLCELINRGKVSPALVIGIPVGFVGAAESKKMLMNTNVPYVTLPGSKGGSTIAAAVVNALLYLA